MAHRLDVLQQHRQRLPVHVLSATTPVPALDGVAALGRLTLSARARATRTRGGADEDPALAGFADVWASDMAARLQLEPTRDAAFVRGVVLRTQWFDRVLTDFVNQYPDAQAVSLGAGLCTRWRRLRPSWLQACAVDWLNVDLPSVIAWRNHHLPPVARETNLACSVLDLAWWDTLQLPAGRPVLVMLEGVCPYLPQAPLEHLLVGLAERLQAQGSPSWLVFDFIDPALLHRPMQVDGVVLPVQSGFTHPGQVTGLHPSMALRESEHPFSRFSDGHRQFEASFVAACGRRPYTWASLSFGAGA